MTHYRNITIDNLNIFYREAGDQSKPTLLLLHGFPTSSFMFRDLITRLENKYHLVAPDFPGFGQSSMPLVSEWEYSFDNLAAITEKFILALGLEKFSLYIMDYGAPVGLRLALKYPNRIQGIITQNGNAYEEGLTDFWNPIKAYWSDPTNPTRIEEVSGMLTLESTKWQYLNGTKDPSKISPDTWLHDQTLLDRPGNKEIQQKLFLSYSTNPPLYESFQAYFRKYQPPVLVAWGKNDAIFPEPGAEAYKKDLKNLDYHIFDTGHFALEECGEAIANLIDGFLTKNVSKN
ncbi:pimeloyl-ACP methyl ester carboxylesterase [Chitinophaga skermanii]|uniref:Pimeloyl-ACP methyl ester carboxylesterase n=1 Tax=Chitinophaga skermanii TaxID=331697 RepID=A0A327Q6Z5_9BACT|nr:alpha/beta hydrolase [Chitinophaga skermanii]RAJ00259.1 pimeloyl-ACP methyl ester carboxylesterase [Chitinophaga skermanii]